jgi:hypothetical protein
MFYSKYLNDDNILELLQNYDEDYLKNVDEENFFKIYNLFKENNFTYIEDIILKFLDIFELEYDIVETKLKNLEKALGDDYVNILSEDLSYLEYIAKD